MVLSASVKNYVLSNLVSHLAVNFDPEMQQLFESTRALKTHKNSVPSFTSNLLLVEIQNGNFAALNDIKWCLKVLNMAFGTIFGENDEISCAALRVIRRKFREDQEVSTGLSIDALAKVQVLLTRPEIVSKSVKEEVLLLFEELSLYQLS